jgi:hypothetical protein
MPSRSRRSKSKHNKTKRRSVKRSKRKFYTKKQCRSYLSRKIRTNMHELKKGRWTSRAQAIAVSFSQTQKKYPGCSRFLKR